MFFFLNDGLFFKLKMFFLNDGLSYKCFFLMMFFLNDVFFK